MKNVLILTLILFSTMSFARKPAVEDFVGVEPEGYTQTTSNTDVHFNFGNTIQAYNSNVQQPSYTNFFSLIALGVFIGLPFLAWVTITRTAKKANGTIIENTTEQYSNVALKNSSIANLSDYRNKDKSEQDDEKKAS